MLKTVAAIAIAIATCVIGVGARAEDKFPSKPIQMIVPTGSGTATDIVARVFGQHLGARLGQAVVIQNRQGAGGTIATQMLVQSAPDGHTIMLTNSAHSINPWVYRKLSFDTLKDMRGVALVGEAPMALVVPKALSVNTAKEFIAHAKQRPASLHYGSAGSGSATHLAGAAFASANGIDLVHVPYKGASEVLADLMTNRIQAVFSPVAFTLPAIRSGKAVALAACAKSPMEQPVKLGTLVDEGLPDCEFAQWFGIVIAAAVPDRIVQEIADAVRAVAADAGVRKTLEEQGIQRRSVVMREFDAYIKADMEKIGRVVQAAGVEPK